MSAPSHEHEERRALLDSIAILAGFTMPLSSGLPDGARPDVLRCAPAHRALFMGEAKHSESAGNTNAFLRLARYSSWLLACDLVVLAVCARTPREARQWSEAVRRLIATYGWPIGEIQANAISGSGIAWFICGEIAESKMLIPTDSLHSTGGQH